ncbi:hypothetical protein [Amycolatopsis sp. NPDC004625]|uniref:hypothetical protein n=1 Tax=Amycolatopsis sp. NPDC004625 TaxID=3154670 RepID=UPI0033A7C3C6
MEDIDRQMAAQEQFIRRNECWDQVRAAADGASTTIVVPDHVPADLHHDTRSSITALAIRRIWASSRVVYALHPQMLAELADSSSEQLPGPIFSYLPHTNPLVIFPAPIPTTTPDGARAQILGFYVFGSVGQARRLCSSHDDPVNVLLYLCSEEPDTIVVRPATQRRSKGKGLKPAKPARMIKVGWRLGPAFHTARRVATEAPAETGDGRRRPTPHQRRGHFRTYWTGRGRTTPILRFIKPFWVNLDLVTDPANGAPEHKVIAVGPRLEP